MNEVELKVLKPYHRPEAQTFCMYTRSILENLSGELIVEELEDGGDL